VWFPGKIVPGLVELNRRVEIAWPAFGTRGVRRTAEQHFHLKRLKVISKVSRAGMVVHRGPSTKPPPQGTKNLVPNDPEETRRRFAVNFGKLTITTNTFFQKTWAETLSRIHILKIMNNRFTTEVLLCLLGSQAAKKYMLR